MRKFVYLLTTLTLVAAAGAQTPSSSAPQTARQALMEMFSNKIPGAFVKHLPAATLDTLEKSGAMPALQQYSLLAGQLHAKGTTFETFETGPVMLVTNDSATGKKFEITVEKDSLRGDEDDIDVSFQTYTDDKLQRAPFLPRMTFAMKMESGIWKLNEILLTLRLPLADPDFLKSIGEGMKSHGAAATQSQPQSRISTSTPGEDATVRAAMRTILSAEMTYFSTYPRVGFTCTLSDLDGFGGGQPNEHQAMLIPSGLASGKKYGYIFSLSGCAGEPATTFQLVAVPADNSSGRRAFCSNESGTIRYSDDGKAATCLASGTRAQ